MFLLLFFACFHPEQNTLITAEEIEIIPLSPEKKNTLPTRIKARHILISHKNAVNAKPTLRRTREAAKEQAERIFQRLKMGEDFKKLSAQYGDDPTAKKGGDLGVFIYTQMMENFSNLAFQLSENELGICETIFGYHIVERLPLEEIALKQLIVQWKDTYLSKTTRSEEEAEKRIYEAHQRLLAGEDITSIIKIYSDGPMSSRGGSAGWIEKKKLGSAIQESAFTLNIQEFTAPIKSQLGYHILYREE